LAKAEISSKMRLTICAGVWPRHERSRFFEPVLSPQFVLRVFRFRNSVRVHDRYIADFQLERFRDEFRGLRGALAVSRWLPNGRPRIGYVSIEGLSGHCDRR